MGTGYIKIRLRLRREKKNTIDDWLSRETFIPPEMSEEDYKIFILVVILGISLIIHIV